MSDPTETLQDTDSTDTSAEGVDETTSDQAAAEQTTSEETAEGGRLSKVERLEQEGDIAADYLEELLDIADLDGDLDMDVEGDRASVQIGGADLDMLVGRNGEVLEALQELTRLAVYRETGERSRLMLDVGGHRAEQDGRDHGCHDRRDAADALPHVSRQMRVSGAVA